MLDTGKINRKHTIAAMTFLAILSGVLSKTLSVILLLF